jgi:hypothetical protein
MSSISLVQNVSYRIQLNYPDPGGNPPSNLRIFWTLKRNGQPVSGINFPSSSSFAYVPNHPFSILTNVVLNPSGSANISLQEGDELLVRVEARNNVSSVPVFLEASAIIARLFPNVILEPITLRKQNEPNVILPFNLLFDTDNNPTGTVLFVGGPTPQQTSPVTVWENESLFPREYVWKRGNDVVGTSPSYTISGEDKDSLLTVELTVRNGNSLARRTGSLVVGNLPEESGWTDLTQFLAQDSRIVYIATDGNDTNAAQVKGRGYYLPSDPEIGPDPTNPIGPIIGYRNPAEAAKRIRANSPEWVLFRRGQTFSHAELVVPPQSVWVDSISSNIGMLFAWAWVPQQGRFGYENGIIAGRSPSERFVFSAWGPPSEPRPKFAESLTFAMPGNWGRFQNTVVASLDIDNFLGFGLARFDQGYTSSNILIEDCRMRQLGHSGGPITVRRSVITGNFSPTSHNQGVFVRNEGGDKEVLTFEECVFDHNGFKDNPFDPSTWSSAVFSSGVVGALPAGTGVQPSRTFYDRNIYCSTGNGIDHMRFTLRGSIVSRGGGGGTVQMRQGGISERNVFMWNEDAGVMISGPGGVFSRNLVLHDDHMLPPGGWGMGLKVFNSETWNSEGYGWSLEPDPHYIVDDSIFAHFHRGSNGGGMLDIYNTSTRHHTNGANLGTILNGRVTVTNNVLHRSFAEGMRLVTYGTWDAVTVGGNQIGVGSGAVVSTRRSDQDSTPPSVHLTSVSAKGSVPYSIGDSVSGGNLYWSQSSTPFANRTFAQWQALRSGLDSQSQFFADFTTFKTAAGWMAPERDIVSYMQSIVPTYTPNEDVTTDDGVPIEKRRPDAQLVRSVMQSTGMSDAQARLTARRYHAFITFIERAKANRKGNWDSKYTGDALNNHIRQGFGKQLVGGPYDTRPVEDRFSDYI